MFNYRSVNFKYPVYHVHCDEMVIDPIAIKPKFLITKRKPIKTFIEWNTTTGIKKVRVESYESDETNKILRVITNRNLHYNFQPLTLDLYQEKEIIGPDFESNDELIKYFTQTNFTAF